MDERLLDLYNTELRHLRETAAEFGREFPKIASRLALDRDAKEICPDPYVERLLEGFAFLAARVQLKLEAQFPRFTQGMLETLYPDYLCPIPSMAVIHFEPEANESALADGVAIQRGSVMRSLLGKGERTACTFTTAHEVRLFPLKITEARYYSRDVAELNLPRELQAKAALRIRLQKTIPDPFEDIQVDALSFYIRGADELPGQIFEQIFAHGASVVVQSPGERRKITATLPASSIRRVGFREDEALFPPSPRGFEGYRLIREYFALPQRFLFFELSQLRSGIAEVPGDFVDLIVVFDDQDTRLETRIDSSCFELFCTPAINLFSKTLDRILISDRFSEFHVVPDRNRPLDFEVFRLEGVTGYGDTPDQERDFRPFYLTRDFDAESGAFFTLQRTPRLLSAREKLSGRRSNYGGSDVFLSLVDATMAPFHPDLRQLGIKALCTNRHLPIQMAVGIGRTDFTLEASAPVASIRILSGPTLPKPSLAEGSFSWRLVNHLALNYFSLIDSDAESGAKALREMLGLYADSNDRLAAKQINAVRHIHSRRILRRVETAGPVSFARGLELTVLFDETGFEGVGVCVLGAVLEQFFAKYVSLNSFTETVVASQQRREILRWPSQLGKRPIL